MLHVEQRKSRKITKIERRQDALYLQSEWGSISLKPQTEEIVRISCTIDGKQPQEETSIGICYAGSFSDWGYQTDEKMIRVRMPKLTIEIDRETGSFCYRDETGNLLLRETANESKVLEAFDSYKTVVDEHTKVEEIVTPDGIKQMVKEASREFDKKLYHTRLSLEFCEQERLYGLGQAEEGLLNLRGSTQYLHQANLKISIPFLLSSNGYALLFATGSPAVFSDTQYGSYFYTEADRQMDFYMICGKRMDDLVKGYRILTGKAALLPRWAFGFIQSQERYETQEEILEIAREYRNRKIGLDAIVLDWCSWTGEQWGQKSFDPQRFPSPKEMTDRLHAMNVHFMISVWPNMRKDTENYREFLEKKYLLPASEIYDAFSADARKLYWKQAKEGIFDYGTDAWWCDSSEPFCPEWGKTMKPEPSVMYRDFVSAASQYLPQEVMNGYGLVHAQTIYEGQRGCASKKRVTNLTRNTYLGGQKYGVILWSGDISASWDTLRKQIVAGLNFCASGFPYWTLDIGAFFVKKGTQWFWNGDYDEGETDLGYRELFVGWFQYGAFLPVFRSHGTDIRREMWNFGEDGDMFYEALKAANQLRYRLIPYIYSWAGKVWKEDRTMMRMLAFDFADDACAMDVKDEYMLGESILVCPVTKPMYYGVHSRELKVEEKIRKVYLPKGCDWYDFYTDRLYEGGQTIVAEAPIDHIPLFIKAGSILPMTEPLQSTEELKNARVEFHVYPGADAQFHLYEDDGDGYGYEQGEYTIRTLIWQEKQKKLFEQGNERIDIPRKIHVPSN